MLRRVGVETIGTYVPENGISVLEWLSKFSVNRHFVEDKTGFLRLARKRDGDETSDLAVAAALNLEKRKPGSLERLGVLAVVTQTPDVYGLPHVSALVHGKLGLATNVAAFDISLGCSGWVYGISIVKSFMEANGVKVGLLITADPYSKVVNPEDRDTAMLFGDAATATLLSEDSVVWHPGVFVFGTDGARWQGLRVTENRELVMNGRAVFEFSVKQVISCVGETLRKNNIAREDIGCFIMHQGSRYIVETLAERLDAEDRTPFEAKNTGNTVSSTIPLILSNDGYRKHAHVLVCGFGVGLSWAATVLSRSPDLSGETSG